MDIIWAVIGVLFVLWLLGFFVIHLFGGLVHLLLILLVILVIVKIVRNLRHL